MNTIYVESLILEVTRRCNMRCGHCLRGDAQNIDMTKEMIDKVLESVQADSVTFTGGEPSLNIPIIRYFFERAKELDKMPYSFWLATNGKENQMELASLLLEYYPMMEEREMCGVALSKDIYHDDLDTFPIVQGLSFYDNSKERDDSFKPIKEGRAANFNRAIRNISSAEIYFYENQLLRAEMLYVAANGNIIGGCDFSYDHIDEYANYDVWHIQDILKDYFDEDKDLNFAA